jgi:hypothetical protein
MIGTVTASILLVFSDELQPAVQHGLQDPSIYIKIIVSSPTNLIILVPVDIGVLWNLLLLVLDKVIRNICGDVRYLICLGF